MYICYSQSNQLQVGIHKYLKIEMNYNRSVTHRVDVTDLQFKIQFALRIRQQDLELLFRIGSNQQNQRINAQTTTCNKSKTLRARIIVQSDRLCGPENWFDAFGIVFCLRILLFRIYLYVCVRFPIVFGVGKAHAFGSRARIIGISVEWWRCTCACARVASDHCLKASLPPLIVHCASAYKSSILSINYHENESNAEARERERENDPACRTCVTKRNALRCDVGEEEDAEEEENNVYVFYMPSNMKWKANGRQQKWRTREKKRMKWNETKHSTPKRLSIRAVESCPGVKVMNNNNNV